MTNSMGLESLNVVIGRYSTHCEDSIAVCVGGTENSSNSDLPQAQLAGCAR